MDLAIHQRQLRDLIKDRTVLTADADPYVQAVASSPGLEVVREITVFWRAVGIERACFLTTAALKRRRQFDEAVRDFVRRHAISPYVDELGPRFLTALGNNDDPLIAEVAKFELAVTRVKRGDPRRHVVDWDHEPYAVLGALIHSLPLNEEQVAGSFQTIVSGELPRLFRVTRKRPANGSMAR